MPKAKGGSRPTTVADARKLGLVPSYSTIVGLLDKPGLNIWMQEQILDACLEWPFNECSPLDDYAEIWKREVKEIAGKLGRQGRERGTMVHDALEKCYKGEGLDLSLHELIMPVLELIDNHFPLPHHAWVAESSFAFAGYGGKVDLHTKHWGKEYFAVVNQEGIEINWAETEESARDKADNFETVIKKQRGIIIDFKTKDVDDIKKMKPYPTDVMQHAAYRDGLYLPRAECYTLFINVRTPGQLVLHKWKEEEVTKGAKMFNLLKQFWYLKNGMTYE